MRQKILSILFALFILLQVPNSTLADQATLSKATQDYAFQYSKYVEADDKYQTARSQYLSFQTALSKNDAFLKTRDKLKQVDQLYITYILLIKETGNSLDWTTASVDKNQIVSSLDSEINYFSANSKTVDGVQTLEEFPKIAADLKTHIDETTTPTVFGAQVKYKVVQSENAIDEFSKLSETLKAYSAQKIPHESSSSYFANWNSEVADIKASAQAQADIGKKILTSQNLTSESVTEISDQALKVQKQLNRAKPLFAEVTRL